MTVKEFRVKLDRGREQIEGLYRDIQAFLSTGPYRLITEFDQQRKENIIRFKGHRPRRLTWPRAELIMPDSTADSTGSRSQHRPPAAIRTAPRSAA